MPSPNTLMESVLVTLTPPVPAPTVTEPAACVAAWIITPPSSCDASMLTAAASASPACTFTLASELCSVMSPVPPGEPYDVTTAP